MADFWNLPLGARPDPLAYDELGNPVLRDYAGRAYTSQPQTSPYPQWLQDSTAALNPQGRGINDRRPGRGEQALAGLSALSQHPVQGLLASVPDPMGPNTYGDVMGAAIGLLGAGQAVRAPEGALRSFAGRVETPAQEVARMLREGRAADITDDLIARADPQELHSLYQSGATGAEMPMDEASRMARAREMGFDVDRPQYHGTNGDFSAFDDARIGRNFGSAGDFSAGHYTTGVPENASKYAEFTARRQGEGDPAVMPLTTRGERFQMDYQGTGEGALQEMMPGASPEEMTARLRNFGMDGVDVWQPEKYRYGHTGPREVIRERVTYDPANIRSRFARFDPRLSHLRNLSASAGGAGLLGWLFGPQDDNGGT